MPFGSSSLLVIQVHGSEMATSEERLNDWQTTDNKGINESSLRDELSSHPVFTNTDEEPILFPSVGKEADHVESASPCGFYRLFCLSFLLSCI